MKIFTLIILIFFKINFLYSEENIEFYLESAYKNNPKLNAERKNFSAIKENVNISRSEFLPSVSLSSERSGVENSNTSNQSGVAQDKTTLDKKKKLFLLIKKYLMVFKI